MLLWSKKIWQFKWFWVWNLIGQTLDYFIWRVFFFHFLILMLIIQTSLSTCFYLTWKGKWFGLVYTCVFLATYGSACHYPSLVWWILRAVCMLKILYNVSDININQQVGLSAALRTCSSLHGYLCTYSVRAQLKTSLSIILPASCTQSAF